jgi:hypothetical protein
MPKLSPAVARSRLPGVQVHSGCNSKKKAQARGFTLATLVRLEQVLGISLHPSTETQSLDELGGYSRTAVKMLEGACLTLRPTFEVAGAIYALSHRSGLGRRQAGVS